MQKNSLGSSGIFDKQNLLYCTVCPREIQIKLNDFLSKKERKFDSDEFTGKIPQK